MCTDTTRTTGINHYGYNHNVRAEYVTHHLSNDYIDTNTSTLKNQIMVDRSVFDGKFPGKFRNGVPYWTSVPKTLPSMILNGGA